MSALYRETPCGHCSDPAHDAQSCPDCRRMVCGRCLGPELCPSPAPRAHDLGLGRRVIDMERRGTSALYVTKKGVLRSFDLRHGARIRFPATASVAHQRLASGGRWPWVSLLEGGQLVAKLQLRKGQAELHLRRKGKARQAADKLPRAYQHKLRLFVAADESVLFAAAHDATSRACLQCYRLLDGAKLACTLSLSAALHHALLLNANVFALVTGGDLQLYQLSDGTLLSELKGDVRWLGRYGAALLVMEEARLKTVAFGPSHELMDEGQWHLSLQEPTMSFAPGDASLSEDGSMLALLGKTRRRLLLVKIKERRVAGALRFDADIDLMRFVEGDRLLVALANGQIIEHWQRSLLAV